MNVLVVAPHPDDEAIGCGGAMCLHAARGDRVVAVFLTSGELGLKHLPREQAWQVREAEAGAAAAVLGVARLAFLRGPDWTLGDDPDGVVAGLRSIADEEEPQVVYLPHEGDDHPDHRAALPIVRRALADRPPASARRKRDRALLLAYEVWTPLPGYDEVMDVSAVMQRKLEAIRCYRSQVGDYRYDRAAEGLARYRGALAGRCDHAEVFRRAGSPIER
jgi:LmbE family N-acetylglucosaminyl deacetylase